jgi:N utilization substance protein B
MGVRREGREAAVQFLYQHDLGGALAPEDISNFYAFRGISPAARRFCQELISGIFPDKLKKIDLLIQQHAQNYELDRLAAVDRNILRLALYELLSDEGAPTAVIINEAISIAKKYGTEQSGRFVNGVLDQIQRTLKASTETSL